MTEREKRDAGLWYDANNDPELLAEHLAACRLVREFNQLDPGDEAGQRKLLERLLGHLGEGVAILAPFRCDCGYLISIGDGTFINFNAYFMDGAKITVGKHVFIGPNCGLYTAQHPLRWQERNLGIERALPITIGDNCWLGGDVKVMPGVTIGEGSVIGAGSLVTRDIPAGVLAVGSPCRVAREIGQGDSVL